MGLSKKSESFQYTFAPCVASTMRGTDGEGVHWNLERWIGEEKTVYPFYQLRHYYHHNCLLV